MNILVCNDDGVLAIGIKILANALAQIAEVSVVAPDRNRSGASNSLTLTRPLRLTTLENGYISVQGTPTDCVHLALTGDIIKEPDLVVSGINDGANLGDDILYSGTVAAAIEGRYLGLPSIAVSLAVEKSPYHYETAAVVIKNLVLQLRKNSLPAYTILNVNVPNISIEALKGLEVTRLGTRHKAEPTIQQMDPRGHPIYWIGPPGSEQDAGPGTDFDAITRACVSITPLQLDLTNYSAFEQVSQWISRVEF